jgi:mono/diheme cytochrome c family protein
VFTTAQAARGAQQFKQACSTCHAIEDQAGSLRSKWGGATLAELFTSISTTMPQNNPGGLSPEEYASIVAYYLLESGQAPGATELPANTAALAAIRIPAR